MHCRGAPCLGRYLALKPIIEVIEQYLGFLIQHVSFEALHGVGKEHVSSCLFYTSFLGDTAELFTTGISLLWIRKENMAAFSTYFETLIWTVKTHRNVTIIKKGFMDILFLSNEVNHMRI